MEPAPDEILVDCQSAWKIFGKRAPEAMKAVVERGLGKDEILSEFDCVVAVTDVSFRLRRGEIFCVMGLSGSGKSTLIRLLNRLIEPSHGRILVKGRDIATLGAAELRQMRARNIGMVFQSVALLPNRTVLDNTAFGLEVQGIGRQARYKTARAALEKVGLLQWQDRYPSELSGGMQQRVGLARVLAADPEVILMDEPFSALDPLIRRQQQDEFRRLSKSLGKSSVFITHDLDEAIRLGDRIAIMKDGRIVQTGTAEEIVADPADEYVKDFVAGISRIHLVRAQAVMRPVEQFIASRPDCNLAKLPQAAPDADIGELIGLVMQTGSDAVAVQEAGRPVGIVTLRDLLAGVSGMPAEARIAA